jgi:hypothetical protein
MAASPLWYALQGEGGVIKQLLNLKPKYIPLGSVGAQGTVFFSLTRIGLISNIV